MSFSSISNGILARYEPYGNDIYLLIHNRIRVIKKDSDSYQVLKHNLTNRLWEKECFSIPKNVQIQITTSCNFKCSFCYANAINSGKPEFYMSKENLLSIVNNLYSNGVVNIQYVGGETFMHKDFPYIVEHVKQLGISQTIITNGIIPGLKIDKYHDIVSTFSKIQISINAAEERYDEIVGLKIYDRLLTALNNICQYNKNVWISFVVTPNNIQDIEVIMKLADKTSCAGVRFGVLAKQGRGSDSDLDYFSCLKQASESLESAKKIYQSVRVECHFNPLLSSLASDNRYFSEGMSMLFINLAGDIFPFPLLEVEEMKIGNIFTDDLLSLWKDSEILNQFREKNATHVSCQQCPTPCALRSPSMSYLWMGKIGQKVPCYRYDFEN